MSPKTTFWSFKFLLSVRPCLAYTLFLISLFFCLKSLNLHKALFGHTINPIFHFWYSNSLFHIPYHLSFISHYYLSYHLTLRSLFYKFSRFPFSLGLFPGSINFLILAYNIKPYAHTFNLHFSIYQFIKFPGKAQV